jgi:hypothetical protein
MSRQNFTYTPSIKQGYYHLLLLVILVNLKFHAIYRLGTIHSLYLRAGWEILLSYGSYGSPLYYGRNNELPRTQVFKSICPSPSDI